MYVMIALAGTLVLYLGYFVLKSCRWRKKESILPSLSSEDLSPSVSEADLQAM